MQRPGRRRRIRSVPIAMSDRERTIFAAAEAIFGAALVIAGGLVATAGGALAAIGLTTLVFGAVAVVQSVLVGLGVAKIYERREPKGSDD